jgi:hypothetical protein
MLPLVKSTNPRGYLRLSYSGPCGVGGTDVQQSWDLTALPEYIRADPAFKNSLLIFARAVSASLTDVSADVAFLPSTGTPTALVLTMTTTTLSVIGLDVWCLHSAIGAVSDAPKLYFFQKPSSGGGIPAFMSELKGQPLALSGLGVKSLVPAPPDGFVRFIGAEQGQGMRYPTGAYVIASNGSDPLPAGSVDVQFKLAGNDFGAATSGGLGSDIFPQKGLYLTSDETFDVDILSYADGADRITGMVSWFDIPADGVTTKRSQILDTEPFYCLDPIAAGKVALPLYDNTMAWGWNPGGFVVIWNADDIEHTFDFNYVIGGCTFAFGGPVTIAAGGFGVQNPKYALFGTGDAVQGTMRESVSTVEPRLYFSYKTVDAALV